MQISCFLTTHKESTQKANGHKTTLGVNGYVYYLDCGDGSMRIYTYMTQITKLYTLILCNFLIYPNKTEKNAWK